MTTPEGREVSTRRINDQRQLREWPVNWLLSNGPPRTLSAALRVDQEALPGTTEMKVSQTATESSSILDRPPCTSCITVADSTHPSAGIGELSTRECGAIHQGLQHIADSHAGTTSASARSITPICKLFSRECLSV